MGIFCLLYFEFYKSLYNKSLTLGYKHFHCNRIPLSLTSLQVVQESREIALLFMKYKE